MDPPIAGQGLLVVLTKRIAGVPDDPTQLFVVVRTLPTAVYEFTMGLWHCTAISETYRVCKLSRVFPRNIVANKAICGRVAGFAGSNRLRRDVRPS